MKLTNRLDDIESRLYELEDKVNDLMNGKLESTFEDTIYHTTDTCLRIVLSINLVKDITYLFLCQPPGIEHSR